MPKPQKNTPAPWTPQRLRERLGFDVRQWARVLNVSVKTVERWEAASTAPTGATAEVFRGLGSALDAGADAGDIHNLISLGLGAFLNSALAPR